MKDAEHASKIRLWLPVVLWAAIIFTFSSLPTAKTSQVFIADFIVKKSAHLSEYAIFTTLLYRALKESGNPRKKAAFMALIIAVIYASSDEFHQSFTPGREPTLRDVIIDTIGASFALFTIWNILPKAPKPLRNWAKNFQLI